MNRTAFLLLFCIRTVFAYAGNPLSHYAANAYRFNKEYLKSQGCTLHEEKDSTNFVIFVGPLSRLGWMPPRNVFDLNMSSVESVMLFDEPMDQWTMDRVYIKICGGDVDVDEPHEPDKNAKMGYFCYVALVQDDIIYDLENIQDFTLTAHGYTQPAQFYSPQYPDGPQYYDVDYRRTLYWNPNLKTGKDGHARIEFYNNSYSTRFKVSSSGLNGGVPYSMDK